MATRITAGGIAAVIAAGEWWSDPSGTPHAGPLRPAVEDLLGAGAVLSKAINAVSPSGLRPMLSPEARAAAAVCRAAEADLLNELRSCASGHELLAVG